MRLRGSVLLVLLLTVMAAAQEKKSSPEKKKECGPVQKPVTVYVCQKEAPKQVKVRDKVKTETSAMASTVCEEQNACPEGKLCKINHVILPQGHISCTFGPAPAGACPEGVKQARLR